MLGVLLREPRGSLPDFRRSKTGAAELSRKIAEIQPALLNLAEQESEMADQLRARDAQGKKAKDSEAILLQHHSDVVRQMAEGKDREAEEEVPDIVAIDEQVRRLVRSVLGWSLLSGLAMIWAELFPAVRILDGVQLWSVRDVAGGPVPSVVFESFGDSALQFNRRVFV